MFYNIICLIDPPPLGAPVGVRDPNYNVWNNTQHKKLLWPRNESKRMQAKIADEGIGTSPESILCQSAKQ
jgi:hypothetical protein